MRARLVWTAVVVLMASLAAGCTGQPQASAPQPLLTNHSCASSGPALTEDCWQTVLPPGSGGFPPGFENTPLWEPGRFPLTLTPHIAYGDALWMVAQTRAYSSPDGLTWAEHIKTDWGERIYQSIVYFKGRLWMFGGLDYQARAFLNDIWSSPDGVMWTRHGTARWPERGSHTVVVYQNQLWLFGGANHTADDRSTDGFLNDVWVSDDGLDWRAVTPAAPWSPRDRAGVVVFRDDL
jgi:hypothetical protein